MATQRRRKQGGMIKSAEREGFIRSQMAKMLGVSYDTIVRWHHDGTLVPSGPHEQRGGVTVYIYSQDDLEEIKVKKGVG